MDDIKARLLARRNETPSGMPEADVDVPGIGTVRVRGMNRDETMAVGKIVDHAQRDHHIIAIGMVDPRMSVSEVREWATVATGGELEAVSRRIGELSGLIEGQAKAVTRELLADSDAEFRNVPSGAVADDGGPAALGDQQS